MAVAAKTLDTRAHQRPSLTLIRGVKSRGESAGRPQTSPDALYRDVVRALVGVLVLSVLLGLGPIWLNTEAARLSKQTAIIKQDIMREADRTQQLQMERYQVASAERIERFAVDTLGMVPVNGDVTVVDVGSTTAEAVSVADAAVADSASPKPRTWSAAITSGEALGALAELASGEAHVLLVGDIGLTAAR